MIRNDYRRALIMLRGPEKGYSGHVRLERRTLRGSLQFAITAPHADERLQAAVIKKRNGAYAAHDFGVLGRDQRGQAGLNAAFDPRNILDGDLDECMLLTVSAIDANGAKIVLTGYLNGSCEIDWAQLRDAIGKLYSEKEEGSRLNITARENAPEQINEEPINEESIKEEPISVPEEEMDFNAPAQVCFSQSLSEEDLLSHAAEIQNSVLNAENNDMPAFEAAEFDSVFSEGHPTDEERTAQTLPEAFIAPSAFEDFSEQPDQTFSEQTPHPNNKDIAIDISEKESALPPEVQMLAIEDAALREDFAIELSHAEKPLQSDDSSSEELSSRSAASDYINFDAEWPKLALALKELFITGNPITPFEESGYIFVQAPMNPETGYDYCVAGLHAVNGIPDAVSYAIPGEYAPEPPPGLEGYVWRSGDCGGFWAVFLDAATGEQIASN